MDLRVERRVIPVASVSEVIVPSFPYRSPPPSTFSLRSLLFPFLLFFFFLLRTVIFRGRAAITCSHYHRLFIGLLFFAMYPIVSLHSIFPLLFPVIARVYVRASRFHRYEISTIIPR